MSPTLGMLVMALLALGFASSPAGAEVHQWNHGILDAKSDVGFSILPLQDRFTAPFDLKVTLVNVQSDQVGLKALLAGDLESYEGAPNSAIVAATHGADVKIIACPWPQLVHAIFVRTPITSLKELSGKAVAISAPGSMPDMVMHAALRQAGVNPSEVKFASLGSDTDRFKALSAGVVSAAVISTEVAPIAPPDLTLLKPLRDVYPQFLRNCVMTSGALLAKRHEDAVHLIAAYIRGLHYAVAHRDETVKLTQQATHSKPDDPRAAYIFDQSVAKGDLDPDAKLPLEKVSWMQDLLAENGLVKQKVDVSKLVDTSVWNEATKLAQQ
jgi:NitT/TauT family transport system substrate-binding protein